MSEAASHQRHPGRLPPGSRSSSRSRCSTTSAGTRATRRRTTSRTVVVVGRGPGAVRAHARDPSAHREGAFQARALRATAAGSWKRVARPRARLRSSRSTSCRSPTPVCSRSSATWTRPKNRASSQTAGTRAAPPHSSRSSSRDLPRALRRGDDLPRARASRFSGPTARRPQSSRPGCSSELAHGLLSGSPSSRSSASSSAGCASRTDSVYPGIALHSVFNGIALLVSVSGAG